MTQDEIIEMAKQAGYSVDTFGFGIWDSAEFNRFAKLVAQHEREACAEVCKKHADVYAEFEENPIAQSAWAACIDNRDAIRARGQA
jgi:hypothetical protein